MNHRDLTTFAAICVLSFGRAASAEPEPPSPAPPPAAPAVAPTTAPSMTSRWDVSIYGFLELDAMRDSTQSFSDSPNNNPILRSDGSSPAYLPLGTNPYGVMYGSKHARVQFTARNTRFGLRITAPEYEGMKTVGTLEADFMGNQPGDPPTTSESAFFNNPTLRVRHANVKLESDVVDVLFGQSYALFGWQPFYFPATVSFLGIPNEVFGRTPQIRISKTVKTDPVNIEAAVAALRPAQRDSGVPDLQGGLRLGVNGWKGAHGLGCGQPAVDPLSVGASAAMRKFRVAEFTNNRGDPTLATDVAEAWGYGVSVDGIIPVIPASSVEDRTNALTLTGSYVVGKGIADLYTGGLSGGMHFPNPESPGGPYTGIYGANIDPGNVQYTSNQTGTGSPATLRVIKWQTWMVGFQYFAPPGGRIILTGNLSQGKSGNITQDITDGGDPSRTFKQSDYFDLNVFADVTPAVRAGLSWQRIQQTYVDEGKEKNDRFEIAGYYFF